MSEDMQWKVSTAGILVFGVGFNLLAFLGRVFGW